MYSTKIGWTIEEDNILREYYPLGGYRLCIEKGLNKKPSTIRMRAMSLGIRSRGTVWSKEDLNILYTYGPTSSVNVLAEKLKGKTPTIIRNKLFELGIKAIPKWTEDELDILRKYYPIGGSKLVKKKGIDKPTSSISSKSLSMGLRLDVPRVKWSLDDVDILLEYYPKENLGVLNKLDGKTEQSVINKVNSINTYYKKKYSYWNKKDMSFLKTHSDKSLDKLVSMLPLMPIDDILDLVFYFRWRYLSTNTIKNVIYSESEIRLLVDKYIALEKDGVGELINNKISLLEICKITHLNSWSYDEINILKANYFDKSLDDLCKLLPKKRITEIRFKAYYLGLLKNK